MTAPDQWLSSTPWTDLAPGLVISGQLSVTLDAITLSAQGQALATGEASISLAAVTLSAQGQTGASGQLNITLDDIVLVAERAASVVTPTSVALQYRRAGRYAFVIVFEGVPIACTTSEDLAGISAAWDGTPWDPAAATWYPTAFLPGAWSQQIEFFNPKIRADSISFEIGDRGDTLVGAIFGQNAQSARTYLKLDLPNDETTIQVQETGGFTATGDYYLYIGNETIKVNSSALSSGGWAVSDRAQFALHKTESGAPFAPAHRLNTINGSAPRVTDKAVTWVNRKVAIYLHHFESAAGWVPRSDALLVWEGLVRSVTDSGKRTLIFSAVHVQQLLSRQIFEEQFTADAAEGRFLAEGMNRLVLREYISGGSLVEFIHTFTAGWYTWRDLLAIVNSQLVPSVSGLTYAWHAFQTPEGLIWIQAHNQPGTSIPANPALSQLEIGLSRQAWQLLGWSTYLGDTEVAVQEANATFWVAMLRLARDNPNDFSDAYYSVRAPGAPLKYLFPGDGIGPWTHAPRQVRLANMQGSWSPQPSLPPGAPNTTEGYLQFGDMEIVGGKYDDVTHTFTVTHRLPSVFSDLGFNGKGGITLSDGGGIAYSEAEMTATIHAKQVWYEQAPLGKLLLRLLLSTGTAGYNSTEYDVNPRGIGLGIPYSLVKVGSFLALSNDLWTFVVTEPTEFARIFESALATYNRYLIWRGGGGLNGGALELVSPKVDGPAIATAWICGEYNKAQMSDRAQAQYGGDGIINRVELKYDRDLGGSFRSTETVDDVVSQSDFGLQRAVSVEAWGVESLSGGGLPEVGTRLAGNVLAYFSRPMTIVDRTISKALIQAVPGDTVLINDPYVLNPKTGKRGIVNWPAWVVSQQFDPRSMSGKLKLAYSAEFPTDKICPWAWSARVDKTVTNGGYVVVDGSTRYLQVETARYRDVNTPMPGDEEGVEAGDKVIIRELDPADPFAPLLWHATVASVTTASKRIYLTAELSGWDSSRHYIVTPDAITTPVQQEQLANTFLADEATDSTGRAANDAYVFGTPKYVAPIADPDVTQGFVRPRRDTNAFAVGEPLCVADVAEAFCSINTLLAYRTRHLVFSQVWTNNASFTSTAGKELVFGPIRVPLYAHGNRDIIVHLYCKTEDGAHPAVFTITLSKSMPQGPAASLGVQFSDPDPSQVQVTQTATTLGWLGPTAIAAFPEVGREPPAVYLSIECQTGDAGVSGVLHGVCAYEDHA